jgi:uncharacterized repeat protein (TIGR01451 family)
MTKSEKNKSSGVIRGAFAAITLAVLALLALALPLGAQAATSGGATIYNTVRVTYTSGSTTLFSTANASVTVNTIGAAPTVTNPAVQTVAAGATPSPAYAYIVKSNSNGNDTYTTSALVNTATNVGAATAPSLTASFTLWGGIALGSGAGYITVPFGTTGALTAGTSTIQIGANQYTVSTITAGSAASTNASGNLVAEVPTRLNLTPIGAAPAITAGSVAAGTQVGEFRSAITLSFTTGAPTTLGTDGTYNSHFTITATAPGTPAPVVTTADLTTTVPSPRVTITKTANVANAITGDTITYTITVTNTSTTGQVTGVTVIDPVPAYTTYVANSTRLNTITVAGDGATSPLIAGLLVDSNGSRVPLAAATGTLPVSGVAVITFSVTVN